MRSCDQERRVNGGQILSCRCRRMSRRSCLVSNREFRGKNYTELKDNPGQKWHELLSKGELHHVKISTNFLLLGPCLL